MTQITKEDIINDEKNSLERYIMKKQELEKQTFKWRETLKVLGFLNVYIKEKKEFIKKLK